MSTEGNQFPTSAAQEDASMEPARIATRYSKAGGSGSPTVPTLPLHQLHPQPSLYSQLAGYSPPADDPMEVDTGTGQQGGQKAPSTPTEAQVTDVDDADSEAPTQCTQNHTLLPPGEGGGMFRNGRFRGTVPTLPAPRTTHPPPGLDPASTIQGHSAMGQPTDSSASRGQELQQWTILRALYEEFRVVSAKADRAREAERLARQRFEDALITAPKPGEPNQAWIDAYITCLHADV